MSIYTYTCLGNAFLEANLPITDVLNYWHCVILSEPLLLWIVLTSKDMIRVFIHDSLNVETCM